MNIESFEFGALMQNIWEARTPEKFMEARQRLTLFVNAMLVSAQGQAVEAFKAQCRAEGQVACSEHHLDIVLKASAIPREVWASFEHIKTDALNPTDVGTGPAFTAEDPDLNALLNNTALLLGGRANHDVGMMWLESLEAVQERLTGGTEDLDLDVPNDQPDADIDGRLVKYLADHIEPNKFELLLGGMNFAALCDDGEPPLIVLASGIEEEFDIQLDNISEETLETLNQIIAEKLHEQEHEDPQMSQQEVEEAMLEVLSDYVPHDIERPDMEVPIGELWSDMDDQTELVEALEEEFGDLELTDTAIMRMTLEQLIKHITEIQ